MIQLILNIGLVLWSTLERATTYLTTPATVRNLGIIFFHNHFHQ